MVYDIVLAVIGGVILVIGLILLAMRRRGWMIAVTIGVLWLLAMGIYAAYNAGGFYSPYGGLAAGSAGPIVTTILGFLIFFVGVGVLIYVVRRYRG